MKNVKSPLLIFLELFLNQLSIALEKLRMKKFYYFRNLLTRHIYHLLQPFQLRGRKLNITAEILSEKPFKN